MGSQTESDIFQLPENWHEGREAIQGIAIDQEIALGLAQSGDNYKMQLSVPDVGLLEGSPLVDVVARRYEIRGGTDLARRNLLPARARDLVSLCQEDRPVITTEVTLEGPNKGAVNFFRGVIRALKLSSEATDRVMLWRGDSRAITLNGLMDHFKSDYQSEIDQAASPGKFLLETCRRITDSSAAEFMDENSIPGLYYNVAGKIAIGHAANNRAEHSFAAPFGNYVSLVNVSNVSAFLSGAPFPYKTSRLEESIEFMEQPARDRVLVTEKKKPVVPRPPARDPIMIENPEPRRTEFKEKGLLPKRPFMYLEALDKRDFIRFECDATMVGDGELLVILKAGQGEETYEAEVQGELSLNLFNEAATKLLDIFDLANIPLGSPRQNNVSFVRKFANESPAYYYKPHPDGVFECTMMYKQGRNTHQITRISISRESAQAQAARAMDRMLSLTMPSKRPRY